MNAPLLFLLAVALIPAGNGGRVVELATPGTIFEELPFADWLLPNAGNNRVNISIEVGYVRYGTSLAE
jgi:hypothetical protein